MQVEQGSREESVYDEPYDEVASMSATVNPTRQGKMRRVSEASKANEGESKIEKETLQ